MSGISADKIVDVRLSLPRLEALVEAVEADPMDGQFDERSGVERIMDQLRTVPRRRLHGVRTTITLAQAPSPEVETRTRAALAGLCAHQRQRLTQRIATVRHDGIVALVKGTIFLVVCMALAALSQSAPFLPDLLRALLSEGFVIAGWVALWHPTELLLYEWWPLSDDRRLYGLVDEMEIVLEPAAR